MYLYIQCVFNVLQYTCCLAYANSLTYSLPYPKSRDAIASKIIEIENCHRIHLFLKSECI